MLNRRQFGLGLGATAACSAWNVGRRAAAMQQPCRGKTYHIDPAGGNDANDGLSPSKPFKNYIGHKFIGGDRVLFKRGGVIRDALHAYSGEEHAPIIYGAYGNGPRPVFLGSLALGNPDKWIEERPSIWRCKDAMPSEVCNIVFNNGQSCGNLRWRGEELHQPGEWHYTGLGKIRGGDILYLCSPTNPGNAYADIECSLWGQRRLVGGEHDVILENLSFRNSGVHGYQESHARRVVIRNCEFRFIGGAVWNRNNRIRFGNGVEFWDGASDVTVESCVFDNIYDAGVTHQGGGTQHIPERVRFRNNLFLHCGLAAYESREPSRDVYFEYNTCIGSGGGFSMQGEDPPRRSEPYPQPLGYHVWAWLIDAHTQPGNVYVRHNVFCESAGAAICLTVDPADAKKFQLDHNAYWQTGEKPLIRVTNTIKNGAELLKVMETAAETSHLWSDGRTYSPSEFRRYRAECSQDAHSRLAKPLFIDAVGGDYRQRADSPCCNMGMRANEGKTPT